MHNLKKWLFGLLILCLLVSLAPASFAEGTSPSPEAAAKEVEFPLAFDRATGDGITAIAADGQGTIIVVSNSSYLNVTNDNGKKWVSRKLPSSDMYNVFYAKGRFFLSVIHVNSYNSAIGNYTSANGDKWTPFTLESSNGKATTIGNVQFLNGQYVLTGSQADDISPIYTSSNGVNWKEASLLPVEVHYLTWNGNIYSAYCGEYEFLSRQAMTLSRNQFLTDANDNRYAELVLYTSANLASWTQQTGTVKKDLNYKFSVNDVPQTSYNLNQEGYTLDGVITLYDARNTYTSKNGILFAIQKAPSAIVNPFGRSPIYKKGSKYYTFVKYWYSPGVIRSKAGISSDRVKWTMTDLGLTVPNNMNVIQAGQWFIGIGYQGGISLSENGLTWKKIR
ncbi:hypothetical protein [Paenibacillus sp. FSL R7-0337]|uniref:hypothetical protein n=1 Tax=unclassified Paenibacillus TaxID=185978 RepID=UPI00096F085A|nr:hypothetical protein [Paenibacillus sp. FSL R7-0337]OMG01059.1 hypothetical protein BK147_01455 [Paenibacillus sp. FSL R7-0337]